MIPLKDNIPSKTFPIITISIIVLNVVIFLLEISLGYQLKSFLNVYGLIPYKFLIFETLYLKKYLSLITSLFLHGGWMHLTGNMLYLWIFGDNIEDKFGHFKFLIFYIVSGIIGTAFHIFYNPNSQLPIIGASGAIAGVLGAYFILFPQSKILTLVPIFFFIRIIELPAVIFLGFWFLIQFLSGTFSLETTNIVETGVAWWAHIGGFIFGVSISYLFKKKKIKIIGL